MVFRVSHELRGPLTPILGFAAGEVTAEPQPVDVVAEVRRILDEEIGADDVRLAAVGPCPPVVLVERGHLNQILTNLVTNARKYGQPPTEVRVRDVDDRVAVELADHGPGVAADVRPVMFASFTRADDPVTPAAAGGVGLGPAIVRLLAEANDGDVAYRPPDDGGPNRSVVTLPSVTISGIAGAASGTPSDRYPR